MRRRLPINKFVSLVFLFSLVGLYFLFSFRLTRVPPGINFDESSIGYNASLISDSLHDENGRFLPVFVLTLGGRDWKQPVRIYSTALLFKLLGKSYFNLRLLSVIFALGSAVIFYKILRFFFSPGISLMGFFLFATSPSLMIQSHLALENIDLLPFFLLWLYFLLSYSLSPRSMKVLLAGFFLGISFYAYKGMRAMVPVYLLISLGYLFYLSFIKNIGEKKSIPLFLFGLAPFLLPLKWLQIHYAGAVYDPAAVSSPSFFDAILVYLSSFDFSFLFVRGDKTLIHSTGRHGMFLVPNIILFFLGFAQLFKEKKMAYFVIFFCLIFTPLLLTTVGSVYRASRLMPYLPLATFIFTLGVKKILEIRPKSVRVFLILFFILAVAATYFDFAKTYWYSYPKWVSGDFSPNLNQAMSELSRLSRDNQKNPYVEYNDFSSRKADMQFFQEVYFPQGSLKIWSREKEPFPEKALVLTSLEGSGEITNLRVIPSLESGQKTFFIVNQRQEGEKREEK